MAEQPKILLVDDTPANLTVLGEALEDEYSVFVATDGATALEIAATEQPDLILLDIMMPGMDGYEVCRRLKEDEGTSRIPVIFITAMAGEEAETRGLEMGAVDYITKPFRIAIVRARVRTHLELKRKNDMLEDLANRDGLTGIHNRRQLEETLEREWRRAARNGASLSFVLFDIDFFKRYNDTYGHQAGDRCLQAVAQAARQSLLRGGDMVARYGGEEFAVVLPDTGIDEARQVAERIRQAVEDLQEEHSESLVADHLTISAGVATARPALHRPGEVPAEGRRELVGSADRALYRAKNGGRNRVVIQNV